MKTAVVTGASKGIGKAIAQSLLSDKWKVYGVSRTAPEYSDEQFVWVECDLADASDISAKLRIEEVAIDLFVSNAGVAFTEEATTVSSKSYSRMFDVNVLAPMLLTSHLKEKLGKATIITISSVSDRLVGEGYALYCSSKAANTRYFETLSLELPSSKIISLLPDYVDTPMLKELQEGQDFDWTQTLEPDEVADLVRDLESEKVKVESGSNVIVVNDRMTEDLESAEKLYGYNVSDGSLVRLGK